MNLDQVFEVDPYSLSQQQKNSLYLELLSELTEHHMNNSEDYRDIVNGLKKGNLDFQHVEDIPFFPVRLYKQFELRSVPKEQVIKTMTSSGTTGQQVSKIYLDKQTSHNQSKALSKILSSFIGNKRLPLLIIDSPAVIKDRKLFSARGAGILGFSLFGYDVTYALTEDMELNLPAIYQFLEKHGDFPVFLYGFTFIIWEHFYKPLMKANITLPIHNGFLLHGGGWKKLVESAVSHEVFNDEMKRVCNLKSVANYYGMVEQTGSIFMECEMQHLHSSIFSDIIIRDYETFAPLPPNQSGLIQLVSLIPYSYPGHSILTEDIGKIVGIDNCPCGRKGKYFKVEGRIKKAEVRGCSDTYETR